MGVRQGPTIGRPARHTGVGGGLCLLDNAVFDAAQAEYLSFSDMLKATPREEGGRRFIYLEASNQALDYQGEVVLAKALGDSAEYYLRYGNLDLDHVTQIGAVKGIPDYALFEIGRPVEVKVDGAKTMVKGEIFQGDRPVAANANIFWDSIAHLRPPQRWYPSVAGKIIDAGPELDPDSRTARRVVRKVRWSNIGFSKTPVNLTVPAVSTVPFGVLSKCWGNSGIDLMKALEAGYGTDSAALTGGGALREQSLDHHPQSYWDFRDRMAGDLRKSVVKASPEAMVAHAVSHYAAGDADAADWTERFLTDVQRGLKSRGKIQ